MMPYLLDIQVCALEALLQTDAAAAEREDIVPELGLQGPVPDRRRPRGNSSSEFVKYLLGEPKYSVEECIERDMTYSAPLKATLSSFAHPMKNVNGVKRPRPTSNREGGLSR